jgi:hypothetical protein
MPTSLSSKTYRNTVERVSFSTESTSLMLLPRYLFYDPAARGARALGDCLGDMLAPAEPMRGNVGILETGMLRSPTPVERVDICLNKEPPLVIEIHQAAARQTVTLSPHLTTTQRVVGSSVRHGS